MQNILIQELYIEYGNYLLTSVKITLWLSVYFNLILIGEHDLQYKTLSIRAYWLGVSQYYGDISTLGINRLHYWCWF